MCNEGSTRCEDGSLTCVQTREPEGEKCNLLDDDCDGTYDEVDTNGMACFTEREGVCGAGLTQCVRGVNECQPQNEPGNEVCDGLDNDCDGQADELAPGADMPCGTGFGGACEMGLTACDSGRIRCLPATIEVVETCDSTDEDCDGRIDEGVRSACGACDAPPTEVCDGADQDCDGLTDEDALCGDGKLCAFGGCRDLCESDESCGATELCTNGLCVGLCDGILCNEGEGCRRGRCTPVCEGVNCGDGESCRAGSCVPNSCAAAACPNGFICRSDDCIPDPCADVSCAPTPEGHFRLCRDGQCVLSCALTRCPTGEACLDGICQTDVCDGVECEDGQSCFQGRCAGPCGECGGSQVCIGGRCQDDPCHGAHCPPAQRCILDSVGNAQCEEDPTYGQILDAGVPDAVVSPDMRPAPDVAVVDAAVPLDARAADAAAPAAGSGGGGGGCVSTDAPQIEWLLFLMLLVPGLRRRKNDP